MSMFSMWTGVNKTCSARHDASVTLSPFELAILRMLRRSATPLSGRQVANIVSVAPNTALKALRGLQVRGLVDARSEGRATLWTTTADVSQLSELGEATRTRVALVVTAVELEHTEVRNRLLNAERERIGGIWVVRGEVPGDHINWTVYLARAGMGNATSAALVGLAARDLDANLVAFVGTAAGLRPSDQRPLDVIVASRIHNPYVGKQVATQSGSRLLGRDKSYVVPAPLVSVVNACIADSEWTSSTQSQHYDAHHPHAFVAPIVSVEAVQGDVDGPVLFEILNRFQDSAALDMESFGLAAGADIHDLPVLAVRGISDFISDKSAVGNDDRQPKAAGHAAALLRDILVFAHPDDFKRGLQVAPPTVPTGSVSAANPVVLPGGVQIWMDRLEQSAPPRANAARLAIAEMHANGVTAANWLNRALHRPPGWLREDDTGDAWALMTSLAAIAGSKVSWRGFERAAAAAKLSGDIDASSYFTLTSRLETIGRDSEDHPVEASAMDGFDVEVVARFGSVIDFYRSILERDLGKTKARAESAMATLGLVDPFGVLRVPTEPVTVVKLDGGIRDLVAATVLRQFARMMLAPGSADDLGVESGLVASKQRGNPVTRDLADDGLRLAQWASQLRPTSEGTRLTQAQALLAVLVSMTGRRSNDVEDEISKRARAVETDALMVRDVYMEWAGTSGEALAVAARARTVQGDFVGALRMLLAPPDGLASPSEAKHPEVIRLAAFIARVAGKSELALELARKIPDRVEGELMRAAVLSGRPQMAHEAKDALFAALKESKGRHHLSFQALMALARRYNSLTGDEQAAVLDKIEALRDRDSELADVLQVRVLISQGKGEEALRHVRGLEKNELVLEAHADALVATGRAADAARLVFHEGIERGDIPLATEALVIAMESGVTQVASDIALKLLSREDAQPVRLTALRALQRIAHADGEWAEVANRTQEIMTELNNSGLPVPEFESWRLAEALFFCEKSEKALKGLVNAKAISFSEPAKARLFLAILSNVIHEQRTHPDGNLRAADLGNPRLYSMFMRAAADWADDEQIAAAAMSLVLMTPDANFNDAQIDAFREYSEKYFERHGENASIKQLQVDDDDLGPLFEFLRSGEHRQRELELLTHEVRAGKFPLAVLTGAAGRTTTESLIRRDLGYVMAVEDDGGEGERAARKAIHGRVVVDTSALVVGRWSGHAFRRLASNFETVIVPGPVREDVARARGSLAMRTTITLGWDTQEQRPSLSETSENEAQDYSNAAERIWADVKGLQAASVEDATRSEGWLSAITVAQQLGEAVWIDDIVLRRFARAMGVPAFGSLDLVRAFGTDEEVAKAIAGFRENRVVDMPIGEPWYLLAYQAEWDIHSPFALAISRPAAWIDIRSAFEEFRSLIGFRPNSMAPLQTATWTHLAANGLAMATIPAVRPKVVSGLLAWVIFFADPFFTAAREGVAAVASDPLPEDAGRVTEMVIGVAENIRDRYYQSADALAPLVDILARGLIAEVGPEAASRIFAALVNRLNPETGSRVFAAYIQSAGK